MAFNLIQSMLDPELNTGLNPTPSLGRLGHLDVCVRSEVSFPHDILTQIFTYSTLAEIGKFALVNQDFLNAVRHPDIWENVLKHHCGAPKLTFKRDTKESERTTMLIERIRLCRPRCFLCVEDLKNLPEDKSFIKSLKILDDRKRLFSQVEDLGEMKALTTLWFICGQYRMPDLSRLPNLRVLGIHNRNNVRFEEITDDSDDKQRISPQESKIETLYLESEIMFNKCRSWKNTVPRLISYHCSPYQLPKLKHLYLGKGQVRDISDLVSQLERDAERYQSQDMKILAKTIAALADRGKA